MKNERAQVGSSPRDSRCLVIREIFGTLYRMGNEVILLNASPRREKGLTHTVLAELADAIASAGARARVEYLIDISPEFCIHCCNTCFAEGKCRHDEGTNELNRRIHAADALVIGFPVYIWLHNGLLAAFFDKYRRARDVEQSENGKPAIGVSVAGNSGTGLFSALKGVYTWMSTMNFRPIEPIPVTKYNYPSALRRAAETGSTLARSERMPFPDMAAALLTYDRLPLMDIGRIDEFRWLSERASESAKESFGDDAEVRGAIEEIESFLHQARAFRDDGDREHEAEAVWSAYLASTRLWQRAEWPWY